MLDVQWIAGRFFQERDIGEKICCSVRADSVQELNDTLVAKVQEFTSKHVKSETTRFMPHKCHDFQLKRKNEKTLVPEYCRVY